MPHFEGDIEDDIRRDPTSCVEDQKEESKKEEPVTARFRGEPLLTKAPSSYSNQTSKKIENMTRKSGFIAEVESSSQGSKLRANPRSIRLKDWLPFL